MAARKKGYKRLTNAEKQENKRIKRLMVEKGMLPSPKKPLNRKRFAKEMVAELKELNWYDSNLYFMQAISYCLPSGDFTVTAEGVGVLKVVKTAIEIKKYVEAKREQGITKITVGEIYDEVLKPIREM